MFILVFALLVFSQTGLCCDNAVRAFAAGNRQWTADVYEQILKINNNNIIFSPISAEIVLALTTEGACSHTKDQLIRALHLPSKQQTRSAINQLNLNISNSSVSLISANKIFMACNVSVMQTFKRGAVKYYKTEIQTLNFGNQSATKTINDWVSNHTNHTIQNLIARDQLTANTQVVLVNALYLSAKWTHQFKKRLTKLEKFFLTPTTKKTIPMMHSDNTQFTTYAYYYSKRLMAKFLKLYFEGLNVSMVFILPDAIDGLPQLERNLEECLKEPEYTQERVAITLPLFNITTTINFKPILQTLGVVDLFTSQADLCGISSQPLQVDFVSQKVDISVNEAGVKASAATAVGLTPLVSIIPTATFVADHPFLYYIEQDKTGVILFVGRYTGN